MKIMMENIKFPAQVNCSILETAKLLKTQVQKNQIVQ